MGTGTFPGTVPEPLTKVIYGIIIPTKLELNWSETLEMNHQNSRNIKTRASAHSRSLSAPQRVGGSHSLLKLKQFPYPKTSFRSQSNSQKEIVYSVVTHTGSSLTPLYTPKTLTYNLTPLKPSPTTPKHAPTNLLPQKPSPTILPHQRPHI